MTKPSPRTRAAASRPARPVRPVRTALRRAATELIGLEGLILALLLAVGAFPDVFRRVAPLEGAIAAMALTAVAGVAIRFRRGRPLHGLLVLTAMPAIALLPDDGVATTLAALLVPLNLALIALLPDRGVTTRGGVLRGVGIGVQVGGVVALAVLAPLAHDPLALLALPGIDRAVDTVLVGYGAAFLVLATTTLARRDPAARGLLWATAAALVAHLGPATGPVWPLTAGAVVLLVAALEDAHALAFRDALTGLPSRRALDELLDRSVSTYALAMVDIDHFKAFNDDYGHDVGDQVLRMVATRLAETRGAEAFRYGGEEFTLVFRGLTLEQARPLLDEARERVAAATFTVRAPGRPKRQPKRDRAGKSGSESKASKSKSKSKSKAGDAAKRPRSKSRVWRGRQLSVTISIGAAERSDAAQPPGEVVEAADRALYRAKRGGRNRVVA